jgi:hypothetical protein
LLPGHPDGLARQAKKGESMGQNSLRENVISTVLIPFEKAKYRLGWKGTPRPSSPATCGEDRIPYSAKDLKYLWSMWDEARTHHHLSQRYKNIYVGAVGVILTGGIIAGMGQPFSGTVGGLLMLVGGLIGARYSFKSLRQQRRGDWEE